MTPPIIYVITGRPQTKTQNSSLNLSKQKQAFNHGWVEIRSGKDGYVHVVPRWTISLLQSAGIFREMGENFISFLLSAIFTKI